MDNNYQGMRWLKCDLQVQTPEDSKHWLDKDLQLGNPRIIKGNEEDIQHKARKFLHRCYELELDVIGLTDHNFSSRKDPREWFALHLLQQNKSVAKDLNRRPITILPGFEVDIGYHVLCLFKPAKKQSDLEECNRILTKLGLAEDDRFESGIPKRLRRDGQDIPLKLLIETVQNDCDGIVIAAHSDTNNGIINEGNKDDFKNKFLYCVEITQNPPSEKINSILNGTDLNWKREVKQPAFIMSSDAKSLKIDTDGNPKPNSLGYRYTWIKMSNPSIESLRQAFLDHSSRIKLPEDVNNDVHPNKLSQKNIIESISIKNVSFLKDQEIHFSPYFNCIIGGRGSGKSTLIEYLRIAFKKDETPGIQHYPAKTQRIKSTLDNEDAEIEVRWRSNKTSIDTILWRNETGSSLTNRSVVDSDKYFNDLPISFYSQQQLNDLSESVVVNDSNRQATGLLSLVDSFIKDELSSLQQQEREIVLKIKKAFADQQTIDELVEACKKLEHDLNEINLKLSASEGIEEAARRYESLSSEKAHIDNIEDTIKTFRQLLKEQLDQLSEYKPSFNYSDTPNSEWIKGLDIEVTSAIEQLIKNVNTNIENFDSRINRFTKEDKGRQVFEQLKNASNDFEKECLERGMSIADVHNLSSLQAEAALKQSQLHEKEKQIEKERFEAESLENLMIDLHKLWHQQFDLRNSLAERKSAPKVEESIIKVIVAEQADYVSFMQHWQEFSPSDKRTRLGGNWDDLGREIYNKYVTVGKKDAPSPWEMLNSLLNHKKGEVDLDFKPDIKKELYKHIIENSERWVQLRYKRVSDSVDIELFRNDGSRAGSISDNDLSDGQRNTAVLALLLSEAGNPLVIDQPEDELDSNFVYNELIPLLRKTKHERQLIIATHNANLPVNGDAELVYAFDVENGNGVKKACGGLDNPKVTSAILDIMEGSEEAFRRRREKYNF